MDPSWDDFCYRVKMVSEVSYSPWKPKPGFTPWPQDTSPALLSICDARHQLPDSVIAAHLSFRRVVNGA